MHNKDKMWLTVDAIKLATNNTFVYRLFQVRICRVYMNFIILLSHWFVLYRYIHTMWYLSTEYSACERIV